MFFLWLQTIILFLRLQPVKLTELSKVNRHRCQTRLFYFPWKVYILAIHGFHWTATICKWQLVVSSRSPHQVCAYLMESVSVRVHAFVLWTTSAQVFEFVQTILVCNVYLLACACIPELQYCVCVCVTEYVYLCRWTSWKAWWAAVCRPCHRARHSGQCQAPCSRSSPSLTATACGSHSAEGWHPEPCQPEGEPQESENISQSWRQEAQ